MLVKSLFKKALDEQKLTPNLQNQVLPLENPAQRRVTQQKPLRNNIESMPLAKALFYDGIRDTP